MINELILFEGKLELICDQRPVYGQGNVDVDRFDEKDFIHIPPCLWTTTGEEGLQPSPELPAGTQLVHFTDQSIIDSLFLIIS
jgi:hypothetical protein